AARPRGGPKEAPPPLGRGPLAPPPPPAPPLSLLARDRHFAPAARPPRAGAPHATDDLAPGERFGDAAALGHHQDDRLLRGEPPAALGARPAAADRGAAVGRPAVDDPAVRVTAERAVHAITSRAAVC